MLKKLQRYLFCGRCKLAGWFSDVKGGLARDNNDISYGRNTISVISSKRERLVHSAKEAKVYFRVNGLLRG